MANKKYKKGMTDASQSYFDFGRKQEQVLEHILHEVSDRNDKLDKNITNLYDYLLSSEKQKLYSIYTPVDIADLDIEEKLLLVGVLFRLTIDKSPTESQQKFIRSVQRYLEIKEPPFDVDVTAIEAIESMNAQKAIYQVVLEYLMLQDGDSFDETEIQHDLLDSFNLNNKNRQTIEEHVRLLYIATGADGFVEKYGFVDDAEDFEDDADDAESIKNDNVGEEFEEDSAVEEYVGIPLKLAEQLCQKNITRYYSGEAHFMKGQYSFETQDFYVIKDPDVQNTGWTRIDKRNKASIPMSSLSNKSFQIIFAKDKFFSGDSGLNYVVDYRSNLVYYIWEKKLHCLDLEKDSYIVYDVELPVDFVQSMQLFKKVIVMSSNEMLLYFDIDKKYLQIITDACGNNIAGTCNTSTILNDEIYFYTSQGSNLSADDGGGLEGCICIYNIKTQSIERAIELSSQWCSVETLFSVNNSIYAIYRDYNIDSAGNSLRKIEKNSNGYDFISVLEYAGCDVKIYHNWFCCYRTDQSYSSEQEMDSIMVYDFSKNKVDVVATECRCYKDEGVFKPKWIKVKSDFKVLGEWLYYISDQGCYNLTQKCMTYTSHIYRVNLNIPLKPVDLGEAKYV